jgi:hypothetical protein
MKAKWILAAALAASIAAPAFAQIGIYIGRTPPPLRYETRGPIPGRGYVWVDGYWGVRDGGYYWIPGRWNRPPYPGAYWSHPHYDHYDRGWEYHEGHWDHDDHGDHHDWDHDRGHDHH